MTYSSLFNTVFAITKTNASTLIFLLSMLSSAYAQTTTEQEAVNRQIDRLLPKPIKESPNAASLGKYGDYEATSFNGVPNIEILIFENSYFPVEVGFNAGI